MKIINEVKEVMERNGIFVSDEDMHEELQFDSLQFVSIIVELEKVFEIEIDDIYLSQNQLHSLNDFVVLIEKILKTDKTQNFSE